MSDCRRSVADFSIARRCRGLLAAGAGLGALAAAGGAEAAPVPVPYWTDHAVIQRDAPIVVEGHAEPGETVNATLGTEQARAKAGRDGRFALRFAPREASAEPVSLTIGSTRIEDLVVGDVWLCSGQSNMEFAVQQGLNAGAEIATSADGGLRLLEVPKGSAGLPRQALERAATWKAAAPDSVRGFSAACYFMARELRRTLGIPIGAINASFGGSQLRVWLTPEGGKALYGAEQMQLLHDFAKDPLGAVTGFAPQWQDWYVAHGGGSRPWAEPDSLAWQPVPRISVWNEWAGSPLAEDGIGTVWLRRTVELTPEQAASGGTLSLGVIDEIDMTWVNGHPVGNTFGWDTHRRYGVPARFLKAGANEILVAATNTWGTGGFTSPASELAFAPGEGDPIPLAQGWRYSVAPIRVPPPRSPWDANAGIGVRHNAMVAPLGHVALKGAAWYQGESDVDIPGYADRLRSLFAGWRAQFSPGMRMLVVQLANYGPVQLAPGPSGWADLREAQREAVAADGNAALVTAIDLGERTDIHPANKQVLGHRLALAAQGEALPRPVRAVQAGANVEVLFEGIDGALASWSGSQALAFELCGEAQESCRYAAARVEGSKVVLAGDGRPATRVRYGWADSPVVNTYDGRAIAIPGFELPVSGR